MSLFHLKSFVFGCVVLCVTVSTSVGQVLTPKQTDAIKELESTWNAGESPGYSVAVVRGGKILYSSGTGHANLECDVSNDADTIFHAASVSKQFTAFALVLLEQDGKLSLDDDVRTHVPWLHDFGSTITLRHLLTHTSGLRDQWELLMISGVSLEDVITQDHILSILRRQRALNFEPGAEYMYSNMGFTLAAHVVAEVSGQSFPEFCRERIFEPLEMTRTHFHQDYQQLVPGRAESYVFSDGEWKKSVLSYSNAGATSLLTTAPDLCRWLANLNSGEVGGLESVRKLSERGRLNDGSEISYGLGIGVGAYRGWSTLQHGGADAGFRSDVVYVPELDIGVAVVSNAGTLHAGFISRMVLGELVVSTKPKAKVERAEGGDEESESLGKEVELKEGEGSNAVTELIPAEPSEISFEAMAGRYLCPELDVIYEVEADGDSVSIRHLRWGKIPLRRGGPEVLHGPTNISQEIRFERDGERVIGFRLSGGRVRNIWFERMSE